MINVMTASNSSYTKYLFPQLVSLSKNIKSEKGNFFYFYNVISDEILKELEDFCQNLGNISFYPIKVSENIDLYNELASRGGGAPNGGGLFPFEVYFCLDCYRYLPTWVDRILYIHTGDILFISPFSEFYFSDFHGKSLTIELSTSRFIKEKVAGKYAYYDESDFEQYVRKYAGIDGAYFNSGSFLVNVEKQRILNRDITYFINKKNKIADYTLSEKGKTPEKLYFGDQAFFSYVYLGDVNIFDNLYKNGVNLRKYNYSWVSKFWKNKIGRVEIEPCIIHFDGRFKPWQLEKDFFKKKLPNNITEENFLNGLTGFGPIAFKTYYEKYWKFAINSPYYLEMKKIAEMSSETLRNTYLLSENNGVNLKKQVIDLKRQVDDLKE